MKMNEDLNALLNFYLYSDLNNEAYLNTYLEARELDIDLIAENLTEYLHQKQAEIKLADGRKFKENYLEALNAAKLDGAAKEVFDTEESNMILAYRKASGNLADDDKDIEDDIKKMKILNKLSQKKQPPDN